MVQPLGISNAKYTSYLRHTCTLTQLSRRPRPELPDSRARLLDEVNPEAEAIVLGELVHGLPGQLAGWRQHQPPEATCLWRPQVVQDGEDERGRLTGTGRRAA